MSPKRKTKQSPANISIGGEVNGIGNVVGNDSQSNVSVSTPVEGSSSTRKLNSQMLWVRLLAFLVALAGILVMVGLFVRLLAGFDVLLVVELVFVGLISALGISGFLKPKMLADLFGKLFEKK